MTEGTFDWDGRFFPLRHVEGMPKPFDGPLPVLTAGSSRRHAQLAAVDTLMRLQGLHAQSFTKMLQMFRGRFAAGRLRPRDR